MRWMSHNKAFQFNSNFLILFFQLSDKRGVVSGSFRPNNFSYLLSQYFEDLVSFFTSPTMKKNIYVNVKVKKGHG